MEGFSMHLKLRDQQHNHIYIYTHIYIYICKYIHIYIYGTVSLPMYTDCYKGHLEILGNLKILVCLLVIKLSYF